MSGANSPVAPGDVKTARLPVALFRWRLTNTGARPASVTLEAHSSNMNDCFGGFDESRRKRVAAGLENRAAQLSMGCGAVLDRRRTNPLPLEGDGEWCLAVQDTPDAFASRTICFDGLSDGRASWDALAASCDPPDLGTGFFTEAGFRDVSPGLPTAAVASRRLLAPDHCLARYDLGGP